MRGFLITLVACSAAMSALALLYMALTPLLAKRYSATGRYYAWLILVVGLIIPFRPRFSAAVVQIDVPVLAAAPMPPVGSGTPVMASGPALPGPSGWQLAAGVWLGGMVLFLACHGIKHYRFLRLTARWSRAITDQQALTRLQELKAQLGISREIGLASCDSIGSPMLTGFVRPRILLPHARFEQEELCFILKHELVHCKRKDLWYKGLVLIAAALHWFNPIVHWMARAIGAHCELSCDAGVVRGMGADARLRYSETIIGVVRYQSKRRTALSTHFYGGKKGMKSRIRSILDRSKKKAGAAVLCGALLLTLGTGFAFAANAENPAAPQKPPALSPGLPVPIAIQPNPTVYAAYAPYGVTISEDGVTLLYQGQTVRLFADEGADAEAFYYSGSGRLDLSAVRNAAGSVTGVELISEEKAREYYQDFFADELDPRFAGQVNEQAAQDLAVVLVQQGESKYEQYRPLGLTYSQGDGALYFQGQRARFFADQDGDGWFTAMWTDDAGTVNLLAARDASGRLTGIDPISDERARECQSAAEEAGQSALNGLEERIENRIKEKYPEN